MEILKHLNHFLNSHWECTVILYGIINWLFYRRGYKNGIKANPTTKGDE